MVVAQKHTTKTATSHHQGTLVEEQPRTGTGEATVTGVITVEATVGAPEMTPLSVETQ